MGASLLEICRARSSYLCSIKLWLPLLIREDAYNSEMMLHARVLDSARLNAQCLIYSDFPDSGPQNAMIRILVISSFQSYHLPQGP